MRLSRSGADFLASRTLFISVSEDVYIDKAKPVQHWLIGVLSLIVRSGCKSATGVKLRGFLMSAKTNRYPTDVVAAAAAALGHDGIPWISFAYRNGGSAGTEIDVGMGAVV